MARSIEAIVSAFGTTIGEPSRLRILFFLMDGNARTSTELASVAGVAPSTTSVHLARLKKEHLVAMTRLGKHHYYRLEGHAVAAALEALTLFAGGTPDALLPDIASRVRVARTCYDHIAGQLGVSLHDSLREDGWLVIDATDDKSYEPTDKGKENLGRLGINVNAIRAMRRRFACPCIDWSERRPHIGGSLGSELLSLALKKNWVVQDLDGRALTVTRSGRRDLESRFGVEL
jgi:DNA-binding transcriptional ArsR family regulator